MHKTVPPWYQRNPANIPLDDAAQILANPESKSTFPNQFNALLNHVQFQIQQLKEESQRQNPLAWFQPSYEQHLKLNLWIYGLDYLVDFDANRIGKTCNAVINAELWIFPNEPEWQMFKPYTDHLNRTFHVIPRPPIQALKEIRAILIDSKCPKGDPTKPYTDETNNHILSIIQPILDRYRDNPPHHPPAPKKIWIGAPGNDKHDEDIMPEWRKWLPRSSIKRDSSYDKQIDLEVPNHFDQSPKAKPIPITLLFKSYDTADTKWATGAVDAIVLTEGIPLSIFNEIRQRYKYPAFSSWDYTPYEPRNTASRSAIAHKVFTNQLQLPLHPFIFSGFGIQNAPTYILPDEKKQDLIRMWDKSPEGDARIRGIFYTSSPVVLSNYTPQIHAIELSFEQLKAKYAPQPLILFRGLDPGWGHVTACAWMALTPDNTRYIYRIYSRAQRSIEERCEDIIRASNNERLHHPKNNHHYLEHLKSEKIRLTWIDYHSFKTDENTKRPFALNYTNAGLVVRPSITMGPKERAVAFNSLLLPQTHLPHPTTSRPPGSKIYFLINEPGVATALQKMTNLFWQTFEKGEKQGKLKDEIQDYDDDEFDAVCYVSLPPLNYASLITQPNTNPISKNYDPASREIHPTFNDLHARNPSLFSPVEVT